jgi:hypothetical protein
MTGVYAVNGAMSIESATMATRTTSEMEVSGQSLISPLPLKVTLRVGPLLAPAPVDPSDALVDPSSFDARPNRPRMTEGDGMQSGN